MDYIFTNISNSFIKCIIIIISIILFHSHIGNHQDYKVNLCGKSPTRWNMYMKSHVHIKQWHALAGLRTEVLRAGAEGQPCSNIWERSAAGAELPAKPAAPWARQDHALSNTNTNNTFLRAISKAGKCSV